ncbi:MAG TPA: glycosyltransferase family 4 protein [Opitutaceae bacterium]|jgi:glycosyltransferase involved in cell wall biosynthesis
MNSLLLTPDLFTENGGITRILRLYLKALCELSAEGDAVRVVSLNDRLADSVDLRRYSDEHLAEWQVCNHRKLRFIGATLRLGVRSHRIVCGHVAQLPLAWAASRLGRPKPYYLVAHGIEVWRRFSALERRAIRGARRILCVSDFTRKKLLENCPLPADRLAILPNALDPRLDPPRPQAPPDGPPIILSISRLSAADSYKGIDHLISALPAVRAAIPQARLRVVGRGDGLPGLQAHALRLGVGEAIEFPGYVGDADLHGEYARCRIFALPSQKEGFGLVYLEAMAHARPSLAARSGGVPEVMTEGTGTLVDYGDVPGIAAAIVAMLGRDWPLEPLLDRARHFSYPRFKERFAALLSP